MLNDLALQQHAKQFNDAVAALIELEAMKAENEYRRIKGDSPAYSEEQILELLNRYDLGYNENIEKYRRFQ